MGFRRRVRPTAVVVCRAATRSRSLSLSLSFPLLLTVTARKRVRPRRETDERTASGGGTGAHRTTHKHHCQLEEEDVEAERERERALAVQYVCAPSLSLSLSLLSRVTHAEELFLFFFSFFLSFFPPSWKPGLVGKSQPRTSGVFGLPPPYTTSTILCSSLTLTVKLVATTVHYQPLLLLFYCILYVCYILSWGNVVVVWEEGSEQYWFYERQGDQRGSRCVMSEEEGGRKERESYSTEPYYRFLLTHIVVMILLQYNNKLCQKKT